MAQTIFLPANTHRVLVVGTSASGKTTLARALAARLGHPFVELDALFWGPQWTPNPDDEFRRRVLEATAGPRWVVDGNYALARDLLWPRATTIVWLNYAAGVIFGRALWRTIGRSMSGVELWQGNRESLRRALLTKDSILLWAVTTYRKRRVEFAGIRARGEYPNLHWIELKRPRDAQALLTNAANP